MASACAGCTPQDGAVPGAPSQPESAELCAAFETTGRKENRRRRTAPLFSKHILSFRFHIGSAVRIVQSARGDVPASESD